VEQMSFFVKIFLFADYFQSEKVYKISILNHPHKYDIANISLSCSNRSWHCWFCCYHNTNQGTSIL